jgi:tRNA G18 (ribose-2'-O)-methylase SpoU
VVRRLLATKMTIISLLLSHEWYQALSADHALDTVGEAKIYVGEKTLVETIVGYNLHQGIMAVAKLPREFSLDETLQRIQQPFFVVALDGLANAENVGVVVRNCAAFGADAVIAGKTSSSPYLRRAVRNSMGAVFHMNIVHSNGLQDSLMHMRQHYGAKIIATHPHEESTIANTDFSGNICIVLGNEGEGISSAILESCTHRVTIPMMKGTDSLNVASASAVFLYEVNKQRTSGH